jgi:hypothetical protein
MPMGIDRASVVWRGGIRVLCVAVPCLVAACQNKGGYEVHIGQPFYAFNQLFSARVLGTDLLRNRPSGEAVRLSGIYTAPDSGLIPDPMIRMNREDVGLQYVILSRELDVEDGDLIEVAGRIVQTDESIPGREGIRSREVLVPEGLQIIHRSSRLKQVVQNEYSKIRPRLQEQITPEGSHLTLPEKPRWYIVWAEAEGVYIISARARDLMYEAEIDVVMAGPTNRIRDIYAVEWFKGE